MCSLTIAHSGLDLAQLSATGSTKGVAVVTLKVVVTLNFGVELTPIVRCNLCTFRWSHLVLPNYT